ncbi:MAG: alanine racemase [Nitrospirae bacterium]|nr:alanine racemase [Nitrospirota bacterium]
MRPTSLDIDLAALRHNFRQAKALAGGRELLCVVKANAYGHGLVPVSRALAAEGGGWLGVATVAEGITLREAGIGLPVLLMGGFLGDEAADVVRHRLTPALFTPELIAPLSQAALAAGITLGVHVKVDTGMGRIGFSAGDAAKAILDIMAAPGLKVDGVFTHFAEADLADSPAALEQLDLLLAVYRALGGAASGVPTWHAANSAALMRRLGRTDGPAPGLFRPGIMLYGEAPGDGLGAPVPLRPVATWRARLIQVKSVPAGTAISYGRTFVTTRPSRIATLPVGYADGFRRALSNNGSVLIRGHHAPVVGRVCMDMTMVDVTDLPDDVGVGEAAVLIGRQGERTITATDLAGACGTIAYDILCGISERVPRVYVGA